jgi:hypothetical protein
MLPDVKSLEQLKAEHLEQRRLVEEAKAYLASLPFDVFREVIFDAMVKLEARLADQPQATSNTRTASRQPSQVRIVSRRSRMVAAIKNEVTLREAVTQVLAKGAALTTGEIVAAIQDFMPKAEYASIASEIKRMRTDTLVEQRGENESNRAMYVLASDAKIKEASR